MIDNKFVVRISENHYAPLPGTAVHDMYIHREHYPSHQEVEEVLARHFSDWDIQVVPI